jgi:transcriptional regulator NrdR family protein
MRCPKCEHIAFKVDDSSGKYVSGNGEVVSLTIICTNCNTHIVNDYHQAITLHFYQEE